MKHRMRRHSVVASIAVLGVAALAACSSGGGSGTSSGTPSPGATGATGGTVTIGYAGGSFDTFMKNQVARVQSQLGVTVKTVVYPTYDDELNQLPNQFAAGTAPDIIQWDNSAPVNEYASEGVIAPLDDLVKGTSVDMTAYPAALVKAWTIDGKLYAVPSYLQNSAMVYNMDVLKAAGITEPPTTMQQVADDAKKVHDTTGKAGVVLLENLFHLTQYVLAYGGGWGNGTTIDSAQNEQALQSLVDLFASGAAQSAEALGATWDGEAIAGNKAAMSDGGPWYIAFMQSTAPKVTYQLQPVPSTTAGSPFVTTYGGGFSVNASAKDQSTAAKVVALLTDATAEKAIMTDGTGFVPAMSQYVDQYRTSTPQYAAFTDSVLGDGRTLDYPLKTTEFGNALVSGFQQLVANPGGSSVKDLLSSLQSQYGQNG